MVENVTTGTQELTNKGVPPGGTEIDPVAEYLHPSFNIAPNPKYYVVRPDDIYSRVSAR